jgi:multidrug efflux pump subunit AcrB
MAHNGVASNLLMILILLLGAVSATTVKQEVFPEASLDAIRITVEYPGASPAEIEEGIVRRIEEQIESVDGIKRLTSVSAENFGVVTAELKLGADAAGVLDDIKAEVDRITTFPEEAEEPSVVELTNRRQAMQLAVSGRADEKSLKELANRIKDEILQLDEVSYVRVNGVRDYEISIEPSEESLRRYGLQLADVASAVRRGSLDLPGGAVETAEEEILIRTKGENYTGRDFEQIIVRARPDGTTIRIGDVAAVRDGFQDSDLIARFDGNPTALVEVYRTGDERVLDIVEVVYSYVDELTASLPEGITVDVWQDEAKILKSRFELLIKNGIFGLILVVLALTLFLTTRLAVWVSIGILISFMGAFAVMAYLDVSVNLMSLAAFILALGIVVDDAIVIGENIFREKEKGYGGAEASSRGATRLARPVIFAVLTTVAAFTPLLFAPGVIGKFMRNLPIVIIAVLILSLVESLLILPAHLRHARAERGRARNPLSRLVERLQDSVSKLMDLNINGPLDATLRFATRHTGIVLAAALSIVLLSGGLIAGGFLKFSFFPDIEGENVIARVELPPGTPASQTREVAEYIETKGREAVAELQRELPEDHPPVLKHVLSTVGRQPSLDRGPAMGMDPGLVEPNIAEVDFELLEAELRDLSAEAVETAWREKVGSLPSAKSLVFQSAIFSLGKPIQLEISAVSDDVLHRAVDYLKSQFGEYSAVFDVEDDREVGKRELKLSLRPQARTLGITLDDLARQVRAAFYGLEARRIQRGRDEIKVMVRLPESERNSLADLRRYRIRTASGAEIPLAEVAEIDFGFGPSSIQRRDRRRIVTVQADVNEDIATAQEVIDEFQASVMPQARAQFPGLRATFEGEQREQADTIRTLAKGFAIALFVIYGLLAIPFKSYGQPFIIMSAIPFGIVGAILGHALMGLSVGVVSMFGIIGLSGVVVNDSLVLIDYINRERERGRSIEEAVIVAAKVRFRPIFLTSITTFLGVLPLILERSLQAQFLIPMAVSLGLGVLFATFIIMILVPALVVMQHHAAQRLRQFFRLTPHSAGDAERMAAVAAPGSSPVPAEAPSA